MSKSKEINKKANKKQTAASKRQQANGSKQTAAKQTTNHTHGDLAPQPVARLCARPMHVCACVHVSMYACANQTRARQKQKQKQARE